MAASEESKSTQKEDHNGRPGCEDGESEEDRLLWLPPTSDAIEKDVHSYEGRAVYGETPDKQFVASSSDEMEEKNRALERFKAVEEAIQQSNAEPSTTSQNISNPADEEEWTDETQPQNHETTTGTRQRPRLPQLQTRPGAVAIRGMDTVDDDEEMGTVVVGDDEIRGEEDAQQVVIPDAELVVEEQAKVEHPGAVSAQVLWCNLTLCGCNANKWIQEHPGTCKLLTLGALLLVGSVIIASTAFVADQAPVVTISPTRGPMVTHVPSAQPSYSQFPSAAPTPTGSWLAVGEAINGTTEFSRFGSVVALSDSGSCWVAGAPGTQNGTAYAYCITPGDTRWMLRQSFAGDNPQDEFGSHLAISGRGMNLVVAAGQGFYARAFTDVQSDFDLSGYLQHGGDLVGRDREEIITGPVAMSQDGLTVAVQVRNGASPVGLVVARVFRLSGDRPNVVPAPAWNSMGDIVIQNETDSFSNYVNALDLSDDGECIAVGLPYAMDVGRVWVFRLESNNETWVPVGAPVDGVYAGGQFGHSVSMSGNCSRLAVGAPYETEDESTGIIRVGCVRIFEYNEMMWEQVGADIYGDFSGDLAGWSVALSKNGTTVAFGAVANSAGLVSDSNPARQGYVRVYRMGSTDWVQLGDTIFGDEDGDSFGSSVSLSEDGQRLLVGAAGVNSFSGQVRILDFERS